MNRLGILLSGRGSNFLAIHKAIEDGRLPNTEIAIVLSNIASAPGLQAARDLCIPAHHVPLAPTPQARDEAFLAHLRAARVDLVCLAGYMRILSPAFIAAYPDRVLNIHPSLLPSFPGLEAQAQALSFGAKVSGCTVHFVDEHMDHGVIVLQRTVPILDDDTPATLAARILIEEHLAYPEAIARVLSGRHPPPGPALPPRAPKLSTFTTTNRADTPRYPDKKPRTARKSPQRHHTFSHVGRTPLPRDFTLNSTTPPRQKMLTQTVSTG